MGILQDLHDSEINFTISAVFDGSWVVKLGDDLNGYDAKARVTSEAEAMTWLEFTAPLTYPESAFAKQRRGKF